MLLGEGKHIKSDLFYRKSLISGRGAAKVGGGLSQVPKCRDTANLAYVSKFVSTLDRIRWRIIYISPPNSKPKLSPWFPLPLKIEQISWSSYLFVGNVKLSGFYLFGININSQFLCVVIVTRILLLEFKYWPESVLTAKFINFKVDNQKLLAQENLHIFQEKIL